MIRSTILVPALAAALLSATTANAQSTCAAGSGAPISVTNLAERDAVTHELLLVQGKVSASATAVKATVDGAGSEWPAAGGAFKALVRLKRGANRVVLSSAGHADRCLDITYAPVETGHRVLLVQFLGKGQNEGPGVFKAPAGMASDAEAARNRYRFGALLAQSALAELMHRAGRGRRTFALKRDSSGQVEVGVIRSGLTLAQLKSASSESAQFDLSLEAHNVWDDPRLHLTGFLQADSVLDTYSSDLPIHVYSNIATWPAGVDDVARAFTDATRKTQNGTASSPSDTLPLYAHASWELGNFIRIMGWTFGAPTNTHPVDVMGGGFVNFRHLFLASVDGKPLEREDIALRDTSGGMFAFSPWIRKAAAPPVPSLAAPRPPGATHRAHASAGTLRLTLAEEGPVHLAALDAAGRAVPFFSGRLSAGTHALPLPRASRRHGMVLLRTASGRTLVPALP